MTKESLDAAKEKAIEMKSENDELRNEKDDILKTRQAGAQLTGDSINKFEGSTNEKIAHLE